MSSILRFFILLAAITLPVSAFPQAYELSGKWYTMQWTPGSWHGEHRLPPVYCVKFPRPQTALELGHGFYNRNAIYLTEVMYPENTGAFVVVSSIPAGRTADEEVTRLLSVEKAAEAAYATSYDITESQTLFGRTIGLKIRNVAPQAGKTPFPLVRGIIRQARPPIETLSVHRIFVRGADRFEVATLQLAPAAAKESTEAEMTERLTALADEIVSSLQSCTASLPVRAAR
jgi:hypothetical protein